MKIPSFLLCILVAFSIAISSFGVDGVTGIVRVLDGDTIAIGDQKIRLAHIDAPELKQTCIKKKTHKVYACGEEARDALKWLVQETVVSCHEGKLDFYRRLLAECYVGTTSISAFMVRTGNAVLYKTDRAYKKEQEEAKLEQLGIWASEFEWPWDWRKNRKLKKPTAMKEPTYPQRRN